VSIVILQTSKTDNNALDNDAVYNLKLRKTSPNSTDSFTANLNALFPWPPLMPKHREWHIQGGPDITCQKKSTNR
jgi:hypothetical protein